MTLTKEEFEKRYPGGSYDCYEATERMLAERRKLTQEQINAEFQAQAEENKARGFSND
jgi:hypothetical protein